MDFNSIGNVYSAGLQDLAVQLGISLGTLIVILTFISLWVLIWKGLALWKAAKKNSKWIFIILLIINDIGIIELLYVLWLSKIEIMKPTQKKPEQKQAKSKRKKK